MPDTIVKGVFVIKVSLPSRRGSARIWRRLAVPHDCTLDDLASVILMAFDFDDDHLYEFQYRDPLGNEQVFNHPRSDDPPFTDEVSLGELNPPPKTKMVFLFDYGDNWEFMITFEKIDPPGSHGKTGRPTLIESHGEAPEQYPDFEEDEEEE